MVIIIIIITITNIKKTITIIIIIIIIADLQKDYVNTTITNQIGRKYFLPQNAKNAKHQGGKFDKCPAKKKTTNQNATLWHLQYLLARYFSKIDPMHTWLMVDILLSAFKLGSLTLFLS